MQIDVASSCGGKRLSVDPGRYKPECKLFSVVTVVYNGAKDLEPTILSVLDQSFDNLEYVVIDGGSSDGTLDILRKYENFIDYWVSEPDNGVYDAFNKACRMITGQWTIFLGAGDLLYDSGVLTRISETVRQVGDATEIVYGKVSVVNRENTSSEILNSPWSQIRDRWEGGRPILPHHQGIFHRKRILSTQNPFDTRYRIAADSKVFYASKRRAEPVFADVIVARATLGGLSTEPKHYISNLKEIVRINKELKFHNYGHQLWFCLKFVTKHAIYKAGGESVVKRSVDFYRQLTGRKPKWVE